ncbi:unnamed protein product [Brugia timori]|uniref:Transcriptional regulator n=1 Tax=Brugia timori TaxID=42155 RepID=A0A0R3QFW4_9BILA|nr:unnamed protein product [Brugia timori]
MNYDVTSKYNLMLEILLKGIKKEHLEETLFVVLDHRIQVRTSPTDFHVTRMTDLVGT